MHLVVVRGRLEIVEGVNVAAHTARIVPAADSAHGSGCRIEP
jgi:hypothetical protein